MNQRKLQYFCAITLLVISGALVLYGCGATPGSGSSGGEELGSNMGTISGIVYQYDESLNQYEKVSDATLTVSTETMSTEVMATSDADGNYTLSGLATGEVVITVSKSGLLPSCFQENQDKMDLVISRKHTVSPALYTIIRGTIEGVTQTSMEMYTNAYTNYNFPMTIFYDPTTHTFEVTNVPQNDTIYILARQHDATWTTPSIATTYGKVSVGSDVAHLQISFEATVTIDAVCTSSPGFSVSGYNIYISMNKKYMFQIIGSGGTLPSSFPISKLPRLQPGDDYTVIIDEKNSYEDGLSKHHYGIHDGTNAFDLSTQSVTTESFLVFPGSGDVISGTPTFEWQNIPWADFYELWVYDPGTIASRWVVWTRSNKIKMPKKILNSIGTGNYIWQVYAYKIKDFPAKTKLKEIYWNRDWVEEYEYYNTVLRPITIAP